MRGMCVQSCIAMVRMAEHKDADAGDCTLKLRGSWRGLRVGRGLALREDTLGA